MEEDAKLDDLIESIVTILKDRFYEKGELCLGDIDHQDTMMRIVWIKNLSVLRECEYIFEARVYDDVIDCCNNLDKASNIDEAWEAAKPYIYDYLDNWVIGADYISDYGYDVEKYIKEFHLLQDFNL